MRYRNDPFGTRLPIKLDTTTNGEFAPIALAPMHRQAKRLAQEAATRNSKRVELVVQLERWDVGREYERLGRADLARRRRAYPRGEHFAAVNSLIRVRSYTIKFREMN